MDDKDDLIDKLDDIVSKFQFRSEIEYAIERLEGLISKLKSLV